MNGHDFDIAKLQQTLRDPVTYAECPHCKAIADIRPLAAVKRVAAMEPHQAFELIAIYAVDSIRQPKQVLPMVACAYCGASFMLTAERVRNEADVNRDDARR